MIEISHLTKKYGTHVAVDDLNLTIEPGRIYGFLGPNGAGKSTTMNMITGYLGATEGIIKSMDLIFWHSRRMQRNVLAICRSCHLYTWI